MLPKAGNPPSGLLGVLRGDKYMVGAHRRCGATWVHEHTTRTPLRVIAR